MRRLAERVRLYESVRTAHLERALELPPATIVFRTRRYDFDPELAGRLDLVQAGPWRTALLLLRSRARWVEINEPLMLSSLPTSCLAVAAVRLRRLAGLDTRVVTYAIENRDPFTAPDASAKATLRRLMRRVQAGFVAAGVDRIAFGTEAARETYRRRLPRVLDADASVVPALPAPRAGADGPHERDLVVFLGALDQRKGIEVLLQSWPQVLRRCPAARLTILGKGPLADLVTAACAADPSIELALDPPRELIFTVLRRAQTLVLPSRPQPTWREQVGLPIVEGLSSGCTIVASSETGLAGWLLAHGHEVVPGDCDATVLADAVVRTLRAARPAVDVLADLPERDGRLAADDWLFR